MRFIGFLLALLCALQSTCWLPVCSATSASFEASTGAHAEVPVNKIGTLLLADAVAFLNGSTIAIETNGQSALNGTIQNSQVVGTGENAKIQGTATFTGGPMLGKLGKNHTFQFTVTMGVVPAITFSITAPPSDGVKHGVSHSTKVKIIVGVAVVAGIATAIAVPVALHHRHHRNPSLQQAAYLQQQAIIKNQISAQQVSAFIATPFVPPPPPRRPPPPPPSNL